MPENLNNPDHNIDDELATFADQVINGKPGEISMSTQDLEMNKLEETILLLNQAATGSRHPSTEMKARIRNRLIDAWNEDNVHEKKTIFNSVVEWLQIHQRQLVFSGITLAATLFVFTIIPSISSGALTGTAGNPPDPQKSISIPFEIALVVSFTAAAFVWFLTREKK